MWHTPGVEQLGLRGLTVSDGPAGARGTRWFASASACVPCGTALGATWDVDVLREVAAVLAAETISKGADVLLAPTVNLHRHPLAGRNFECMSEDPTLTAALAVAHIGELQSNGVGACIKHFVANDQETERHDISAEVPETALRELYLRPFEDAVRLAGTWSIMSAYNRLGGTHCSQHRWLLTELLRQEWGFDGVVISDWWGTHSTTALAAGLDIEMPGPAQYLGEHLVEALDDGRVSFDQIEQAVGRISLLAQRTLGDVEGRSGPDGSRPERSVGDPAHRDVLRRAAVESLVLLANGPSPLTGEPLVPLPPIDRLAVIGPNAADTAIMGGGSAAFVPHHSTDVLSALRERLPDVEVTFERGLPTPGVLRPLDRRSCRVGPDPDAPEGFAVHYHSPAVEEVSDPTAEPVSSETSLTSRLLWLGPPAPGVPDQDTSVHLSTWLTPEQSGLHTFSLVTGATGQLRIDGETVLDNTADRRPGTDFFGLGSEEIRTEVHLSAGRPVLIEASTRPLAGIPAGGLAIGHSEPRAADPLAAAVAAARAADVAVVVVGGDDQYETEGADRATMALPEGQNELIDAVIDANPDTIVLLNVGSPVDLTAAVRARALIQMWYPGQEAGEAVADVLTGAADPGGRLPTTFGRSIDDWSSNRNFPGGAGTVHYDEGLLVGYRDFDANGTEPVFCFGHGLSTTEFEWSNPTLDASIHSSDVLEGGAPVTATVTVTNTGDRPGAEVVQCYLHGLEGRTADPTRPPQHLAGFAKVHLGPSESARVVIELGWTALRRWQPEEGWIVPTGTWEVRLSRSSRDHVERLTLEVN